MQHGDAKLRTRTSQSASRVWSGLKGGVGVEGISHCAASAVSSKDISMGVMLLLLMKLCANMRAKKLKEAPS